ncbi:hypothetical protein GDO78_012913 [Eleutherodactylus coqui]|uniref:Uncharacterized protein n=1 Tax=Eleutherodactylus coqui TaxID=57060 RepID=A0A8J6EX37_ELECQ|nr:hypothetical protein GDO78_012913 [Eleutherodactylus coqui]
MFPSTVAPNIQFIEVQSHQQNADSHISLPAAESPTEGGSRVCFLGSIHILFLAPSRRSSSGIIVKRLKWRRASLHFSRFPFIYGIRCLKE